MNSETVVTIFNVLCVSSGILFGPGLIFYLNALKNKRNNRVTFDQFKEVQSGRDAGSRTGGRW